MNNIGTKIVDIKNIEQEFNNFFSNVNTELSKSIRNSNFKLVHFCESDKNCYISDTN